ncbi:hypothetical protein F5Y09DRAFT_310884 [Xylaria sp. FL1042]|nr:hypothetical protein F5Y09DRAFT_310884 [Xylaria sp. FL1042]
MDWKMLLVGIFWAMVVFIENPSVARRLHVAFLARPRQPPGLDLLDITCFYLFHPRSFLYAFAFSLKRYVWTAVKNPTLADSRTLSPAYCVGCWLWGTCLVLTSSTLSALSLGHRQTGWCRVRGGEIQLAAYGAYLIDTARGCDIRLG